MTLSVFERRLNDKVFQNVEQALIKELGEKPASRVIDTMLSAAHYLASGSMWNDDPSSQTAAMRDWAMLPDCLGVLSLDVTAKVFLFLAMFACGDFPSEFEKKEQGTWDTPSLPIGSPDKE